MKNAIFLVSIGLTFIGLVGAVYHSGRADGFEEGTKLSKKLIAAHRAIVSPGELVYKKENRPRRSGRFPWVLET